MKAMTIRKYVLTGDPYSGKTAVLEELTYR